MTDINKVFGKYDPNKPIVSIDKDKMRALLQALADLPTKLPKGVAEGLYDTYQFYKNQIPVINAESPEDALKEALLIALPTHERNAHGRFKVDEKRTKEVNKYLKETIGPRMEKEEGYNPYKGFIVKKEPLTIKDYDNQVFHRDRFYKDLEPYRNDIIVSEGKGTPYYANTLSSHRLPTSTYNNTAWDFDYPKYPHQMDPEFAAKHYNTDYIKSTIDTRKINDGDNYNYTMGELDDILKRRANARNLYERDYPESPYNSWGSYAKELEAKGITGSDYDEIIKLAREYERTLYDESLDMNSKMNKLNTLKTNIETLESLGGLK